MMKKLFSKKSAVDEKNNAKIDILPENAFETALEQHQMGNLAQADALYRQILAQNPYHADALHFLGVLAYQVGEYQQAIELMKQAIQVEPNATAVYCNLGLALQALGRFDEAIVQYQQALSLRPDFTDAHYNLGLAFQSQSKTVEAISHFQQTISLQADHVAAYHNLGDLFAAQHNFAEAINCYRHVLALTPDNLPVYNNLGCCLKEENRLAEAVENFQRLLMLHPDDVQGYYNLGIVFYVQKNLSAAIENFQKVLALNPDYFDAYYWLFITQLYCCDWSTYSESQKKIVAKIDTNQSSGYDPFCFLAISDDASSQQQCAYTFACNQHPPINISLTKKPSYQHNKIRIAYLSADFRDHPMTFLMTGLFEQHDRQRFEVIGISFLPPDDRIISTRRVKNAFDRFIDVSSLSDYEVAYLLHEIEVDIAIDLMGFTQQSRFSVFAYRLVPIQINYLGYPATMGVDYIDYIFADRYLIPAEYQRFYTEKIVYLPDCFQANDDKRIISTDKPTRLQAGLPQSGFVFCAFNACNKINPVFFDVWMRLLHAVPDSVLWLASDHPLVIDNLRREAKKRGIAFERLKFAPQLAYPQHLARFQLADLFLDTLPFNAGTTASDALWAGVPVLTCSGKAFAARMAGSLLHAIGLPELITESLKDYEALALKLATNPALLAEIKAKLVKNRNTYPLFDTDRFCKHIEAAYITMWERYQRGEAPVSFAVPSIK